MVVFRRARRALGVLIVVGGVLMGAVPAQALPITGGIRFGGSIEPVDFETVNVIDIVGEEAITVCGVLNLCTGTFAGRGIEPAVYNDFSFNPLGGSIAPDRKSVV